MKRITLRPILFVCLGLAAATIAFAALFEDVPSRPKNVHATCERSDGCDLAYDKPTSDGGNNITGYLIEYKYNILTRWTKISEIGNELQVTVTGMIEGRSARFRVYAINQVGISESSEPSESIKFLNDR